MPSIAARTSSSAQACWRHIATEEKVLFAEARRRRGGQPLPIFKQLHADHAALASLLVPPLAGCVEAVVRLLEHVVLVENGADELQQGVGGRACSRRAGRSSLLPRR
jgi:hypothetical protein